MKNKTIYTILIITILGLCTYIFLDNKEKDSKDKNSNSNSQVTSNIVSNTTSNEIESNNNSNDISNEINSNSNTTSNIITSNSNSNISNSNIINSNSNTISNKTSNSNSLSNSNKVSNKTSNSNTTSNKNSNNTGLNTNGVFTGIYQDKNNMLKIFQLDNKLHYVIFKTDPSYGNNTLYQRSSCTISGSKATCVGNNNTISLNSTSITYGKINTYFTGGTLNKIKNYTIENYYKDFMNGDTSLLNTYNGVYINNTDSIKIYQLNSNEIYGIINVTKKKDGVRDNSIPNKFYKEIELTKSGNKLVGETAYGNIEITFGQGKITVKANSTNIKDILYHISSDNNSVNYTYKSKYSLNSIVSEHF